MKPIVEIAKEQEFPIMMKKRFLVAVVCFVLIIPIRIGGTGQAGAAASAALTLWPPSHAESKSVTITFDYTSAKPGKLKVELKYKVTGAASFQKATLDKTALTASAAGQQTYRAVWNKAADKVAEGESVDLSLTVTDATGKGATAQLRNYKTQPKTALRNQIDNYMIYYGKWSDAMVEQVKRRYDMVILNTNGITPRQAARLRAGANPADASDDVLVLGYISVGEDERTHGMTPEQMKKDKRFVLDGSGPAVDPRAGAPYPDGAAIPADLNQNGKMTYGGFAPFYLNDDFYANKTGKKNVPDFNRNYNGAFVNPGHPAWYRTLSDMTIRKDKVSGIREIVTHTYGAAYGLDGLFLDTLDTAAPNSWTSPKDINQSEFEWTAPGTQTFLRKLSNEYPSSLIVGNRALFFYTPDLPMYRYTLRPYVDFVLFESYRMDSNSARYFNQQVFNDNKYNYAQKLLAEADRPDGFRVLSLGYAEGPDGAKLMQMLSGKAAPSKMMLDEIDETAAQMGMVHYMTNQAVSNVNTFVIDHMPKAAKVPVWGSTKPPSVWGEPYEMPRIGLQSAAVQNGTLTVRWDVAHAAARPIRYSLYVKEGQPFDYSADLKTQSTLYVDSLPLDEPEDYKTTTDAAQRFPYKASIRGIETGKTYYVLIRASDAKGHYEENEHALEVRE